MALVDRSYRSIGIILAISLASVILIVGIALSNTQRRSTPVSTKPYVDSFTNLTFDAPTDWTVGREGVNKLRMNTVRISEITTQNTDCRETSPNISRSLQKAIREDKNSAFSLWSTQYPGIKQTQLLETTGGVKVLVGIDTCNELLTVRKLYLRAQTYKDTFEFSLTTELNLDESTSQSELDQLAKDLAQGSAANFQNDFNSFFESAGSLR